MSEIYLPYPTVQPRMNRSTSPLRVAPGSFYHLSGVDGRYNGCLHKYYGMKSLVDLDVTSGDIDAYAGPSYFKAVTFQKKGTATTYRGFVVRWDSQGDITDQQIDLFYTSDNGSNWSRLAIWAAGNGITGSLEIDCVTEEGGFLMVAVDTKATRTIYWNGSALTAVDSGPGNFATALATLTKASTSVDTAYQLRGSGSYQVAYRFYDSTRGIYSALSSALTLRLDHFKQTYATGAVYLASSGGDSGLFVDGDIVVINGRIYEADDDSSISGDVTVPISGLSTAAEHATALATAINGDSSAVVTAVAGVASVTLTATTRGAGGNAYTLTEIETGSNTDDISVSGGTLSGGGSATTEPEPQCKAVLDFAAHGSVLSGNDYDDFSALFDTVDVFRTIDLGDAPSDGAIFYLEQTIAKAGNWASSANWDSLQVTIGTIVDEALPFQTMYDPEKDIVAAPPQSGAIGRYQGQTFMTEAADTRGGYDILHSSFESSSPEYFTTYNKREGNSEEGRPQRYIRAGDALFALCSNAIIHVFKTARWKPIQIVVLHQGRGLAGKGAAHASGNSIFLVGPAGLMMLNAADGSMGQVTAADRVIFDDWKADLSSVESAYDSRLNASMFLNPTRKEILCIWHSLQTVSLLEGANFVGCSDTADITDGSNRRAYFITATGLVVSPDTIAAGSGTMWDLNASYTLNGTTTSSGSTLIDTNATFHADMIGALVYIVTGDNAGDYREIASVDVGNGVLTLASNFDYDIPTGAKYSISPVPFKARLWSLQAPRRSRFNRWIMTSVAFKVAAGSLSGFTGNDCNFWRVGAYRNGASSVETGTKAQDNVDVSSNPADSVGHLNVDGIDVEPYIELISAGVQFELIEIEVGASTTDSREIT